MTNAEANLYAKAFLQVHDEMVAGRPERELTNKTGRVLHTRLCLGEAVEIARPLVRRGDTFLGDLIAQHDAYGRVSAEMAYWIIQRAEARLAKARTVLADTTPTNDPTPEPDGTGGGEPAPATREPLPAHLTRPPIFPEQERIDFTKVQAILQAATSSKKWPKILIETTGEVKDRIVLRLCGSQSATPGVVILTNGIRYGDPNYRYYGKQKRDGNLWLTDDGKTIVDTLKALAADPVEFLAQRGREAGACCFCSRELTDPRSLAVGYGEICSQNHSLPYPATSQLATA